LIDAGKGLLTLFRRAAGFTAGLPFLRRVQALLIAHSKVTNR